MTRSALAALIFTALLGTQAFAGSTGPTNPNPDTAPATPALPGVNTGTNPTDTPLPNGTDPRTQGNDNGRQGGVETDGTRREPRDGTGSENGDHGREGGTGTGSY